MFRKLTQFLFEEEEIVIEEELKPIKEKEEVVIKPVEPLKDLSREEKPVIKEPVKQDTIEFELNQEELEMLEEKHEKRKSVMIDLEEEISFEPKKPKAKIYDTDTQKQTYQRRSVLSPMHGGDALDEAHQAPEIVSVKKQESITQVISPMFGQLNQDHVRDEVLEQDLMQLDLEAMIHEEVDDEVQTSLYDFLEGLENEDE